ncbi:PREDICTED: mitochondrial 2-oxoglutarate/malate carrier protein-like [Trachymyrmex cornetzi]|uniref:mitochondrial 2-oxoglutarate/malate carrier protein-like n=1 Tax=Trachymyrmex cornetzi TaxID=471704 RepID=UPI00084F7574|nr:PREDICTED: mitochondrial 2-oxoglutarate/malate carrier protein-like [Trachymyrmex cornetzi]
MSVIADIRSRRCFTDRKWNSVSNEIPSCSSTTFRLFKLCYDDKSRDDSWCDGFFYRYSHGSSIKTDLVLFRMVADVNLPPGERRKYRNAVSGIFNIWKTEGLFGLWRGAVPTMGRAAIVNGAQLGTYTRAKKLLQDTGYIKNDIPLQITAAMMSSVITCSASIPIDAAKTRIQNWRQPMKPPGVLAMIVNIAKKEGVMLLWRGFLPYYSRAAPNTVITMVCVDQLHQMYSKFCSIS